MDACFATKATRKVHIKGEWALLAAETTTDLMAKHSRHNAHTLHFTLAGAYLFLGYCLNVFVQTEKFSKGVLLMFLLKGGKTLKKK